MHKMLLVDDETFVVEGIRDSLPWEELGIDTVFTASNGVSAMEILKANPIDFMITDIKMPLMDGIELIQKLHQQNYPCKVIVLSGFDNFKFAQEAITYHVVEYVLKPITLSKLRSAVEKAVSISLKEENDEEHLHALEAQFSA
ncbi:MAG: response regulator, partial [Ruthenibacterium sp.]